MKRMHHRTLRDYRYQQELRGLSDEELDYLISLTREAKRKVEQLRAKYLAYLAQGEAVA